MNPKITNILTLIHRWGGLVGGWFFFFMVVTGTISIFDQEITQWMQPELIKYQSNDPDIHVSPQALHQAYDIWKENDQHHISSFIELPSERYPFIKVIDFNHYILQWKVVDPTTGQVINTLNNVGGYFFDSLHHNLFMGYSVGSTVVAVLGLLFLFLLISGVLIHLKNIWKDFFKMRPEASMLRFILDVHNGIGIFFIPFLLITALSGFLFVAPKIIPLMSLPVPITKTVSYGDVVAQQDGSEIDLFPLLQKAQNAFVMMPGFVWMTPKEVRVIQNDAEYLSITRNFIGLDYKTGKVTLNQNQYTGWNYIESLLFGVHLARTGGDTLRFVYFLSGLATTLLVATGLLFFSMKRQAFRKGRLSVGLLIFYKITDGVQLGIMMGTLLAVISVFWSSRYLPDDLSNRAIWQVSIFFLIFGLSMIEGILYSCFQKVFTAWKHQLIVFIVLCILLPIISIITNGTLFIKAIEQGNYIYCVIDLIIFIVGLIMMVIYRILKSKKIY